MSLLHSKAERRHPRVLTRIPARWQVFDRRDRELDLGRLDAAHVRELSAGGLYLSGVSLPVGTRIHVFLPLGDEPCVEVFGEVVHTAPYRGPLGRALDGVGVKLLVISPRDRARLEAFVRDRLSIEAVGLSAAEVRRRAEAWRTQGKLLQS